ncbi:RAMP superfamily CRISPR-associated protein [Thermoanaerobacterium thermosaccharolyticum]|uniref:CRISPR type III-associated protein domain-containing protein n=1 Tax=Thermoanaerobacterium thermosaccharolyticum TaxID=1517 RepID=A0A231VDZ1_THETR|nr:RAMP superfamily CRISPR-associated protein [Thermoanaerobacterium thermosaccharolyticum]OXT06261.1 hypothetical protein CE561_11210 [Thermoanaerobacterium thermosaccharolyticum]TCW34418.1 CRISPR-associated protein Cmr4 [Thermohydrogenium kirishiense]
MCENKNDIIKEFRIYSLATDPIYIGTGGYTIGRVDNTIVREPTTKLPKIPGSSLAGTWRYYVTLEIHKYFTNSDYRIKRENRKDKKDIFVNKAPKWVNNFVDNKYVGIKCAGKDDDSNINFDEAGDRGTGHCGHCIVCKGFGFSKKDKSWQGMIYFGDLNILLFPVFTREGTKWVTTEKSLIEADLLKNKKGDNEVYVVKEETEEGADDFLNLGWLYLSYKKEKKCISLDKVKIDGFRLEVKDIVIVPEKLFSHIVNSNLEVRTSVSIDPITGAAKEGALFTSESIPRGTVLYGKIRIFDKSVFAGISSELSSLPSEKYLESALRDSKHFFETLGIGGMTTRGFGRIKLELTPCEGDDSTQFEDKGEKNDAE